MAGQSNRVSYPSLRWSPMLVLLISIVGVGLVSSKSSAQSPITSSGLNTQVNLAQNPPVGKTQYDITGGTRPDGGPNLFHSFGELGVPTDNIANFLNAGSVDLAGNSLPPGLQTSNILARVTGINGNNPSLSSIYGTIQTTGFGNVNLFLMNPAGFLFGPSATVSVGGMVTFTSADYTKFADGARFNAIPYETADALLSAAPVAAFGFIGTNPKAITVQGSQFTVNEESGISLVGGNITIQAETLDNGTVQPAKLTAPSGQINLASISSPGEIAVETLTFGPNVDGIAPSSFGNISLSQNAQLNATGTSGGTIRIRGGQLMMASAFMIADSTVGTVDPATAISVAMEGDIELTTSSAFSARALGDLRGGDIEATSRNINLRDGSRFVTRSEAGGDAGDIRTSFMGELLVTGVDASNNASTIGSDAISSGGTGSITINRANATSVATVTVADRGVIRTEGFADGLVRDVTMMVDRVNVAGGGVIGTTGTDLVSSGTIRITDAETISVSGRSPDGIASRIENQNSAGETGGLFLESEYIHLSDFGRLFSDTFLGLGDPSIPKMVITVHDTMTMTGEARADVNAFLSDVGALEVNGVGNLFMSGLSTFGTRTSGTGASGPMIFNLHDVTASEGSQFMAATDAFANGGPISLLLTGTLTLAGQGTDSFGLVKPSGIFSTTTAGFADPSLIGNAGDIFASGHTLNVLDGAELNNSSRGFALGKAGGITSNFTVINVNNGTVASNTEFSGLGGNVSMTALESLTMANDSIVSASSTGTGNAGNIQIDAGNQFVMTNHSLVTTEANLASGGNIKVTTSPEGTVLLQNSKISASVPDGSGGGGNISIDPQFVILQNSQILAQAAQGQGGTITITTNLFLPDATSIVNADSGNPALNGTVTIQSPNAPGSGKIQPLGKTPLQATSLLNQHCASLAGGEFSSFTVTGRDSLPTEPGSWLASPLASLSAGMRLEARGEGREGDTQILSLRQIAPPGFLTQAFALDWSAGCQS